MLTLENAAIHNQPAHPPAPAPVEEGKGKKKASSKDKRELLDLDERFIFESLLDNQW